MRHARCDVAKQVLITLAGILEYPGELPAWPVTEYESGDEQVLHNLIAEHHISEEQYRTLCLTALKIAAAPSYQRFLAVLAAALRRQPRIDHDLFDELTAIA
jgi:hypothetical protein